MQVPYDTILPLTEEKIENFGKNMPAVVCDVFRNAGGYSKGFKEMLDIYENTDFSKKLTDKEKEIIMFVGRYFIDLAGDTKRIAIVHRKLGMRRTSVNYRRIVETYLKGVGKTQQEMTQWEIDYVNSMIAMAIVFEKSHRIRAAARFEKLRHEKHLKYGGIAKPQCNL